MTKVKIARDCWPQPQPYVPEGGTESSLLLEAPQAVQVRATRPCPADAAEEGEGEEREEEEEEGDEEEEEDTEDKV